MDPAFQGVGKAPGLVVWRMESFKPIRQEESHVGQFYTGDSYLVLTSRKGATSALEHDIYIWIGSESSTDEAGTAAIKAVELDDGLGGTPVQHREEQGSESPAFISLFKSVGGVIHLQGGVASGFHHVEAESYPTSLLHVKGKRNVVTRQVPVKASSLNAGDVFVLDMGFVLYLWAGPSANTIEKAKGVEVMARLHNSRGSKTHRIVVADASDKEKAAFWGALGGSEAHVSPATEDDVTSSSFISAADVKLYKVSDASGSLQVTSIARDADGRLTRALLPVGDVALVDVGSEVFVWVSKTASDAERKNGLKYAADFLARPDASPRPAGARSSVVREGGESATFKSLFYQWEPVTTFDFTRKSAGVASGKPEENTDYAAIASGAGASASSSAAIAAAQITTTNVQAWIVQGAEVSALPKEKVGEFFAGDSFVVQQDYTDAKGNAGANLYFWLGRHSDSIERGTAALTARDKADALTAAANGKSTVSQIRVVQGSEPPSFASAFNGSLIIHAGGAKGSLAEAAAAHLYHIKGSAPSDTKAVEVSATAAALNSGDAFILITPADSTLYLWIGRGSNAVERETAAHVSSRVAAAWSGKASALKTVEVAEGSEPEAFWTAVGGKQEYPASLPLPSSQIARFFEVSDASGALSVEEVHNWSQDDLLDDEVIVLDAGTQIFVWIGTDASPAEKGRAMEVADKYVAAAAAAGRLDAHVPIIRVASGAEPLAFTSQFTGWDYAKADVLADPYAAKMAQLAAQKSAEAEKVAAHAAALEAKRAAAIAAAEAKASGGASGAGAGDHSSSTINSAASSLKHTEAASHSGDAAPAAAAPAIAAVASHLKHAEPKIETVSTATTGSAHAAQIAASSDGAGASVSVTYNGASYSLLQLKAATTAEPGPFAGANLSEKQALVADADYPAVFGVSAADFAKLPKWKQADTKKKAGLF